MTTRALVASIFFIVLVTLGVYAVILPAPFKTMDDQYSIVANPLLRPDGNVQQIFTQGFFGDHSYYRPMVMLSFKLDYQLFGLNSFFYNLENVLIHILNALLVICLTVQLTGQRRLGVLVGLLFAIHPIQWEAVANISGRAVLLCTLFSLMAFAAFAAYQQKQKIILLVLSLAGFTVALFCKESAGVLPMALLAYVWVYRKKWWPLVSFFMLALAYAWLRHHLGITQFFQWRTGEEHFWGIVTFLRSVLTHLRLLVLPTDLHFDRSTPLLMGFNNPQVWLTMVVWVGALIWLMAKRASCSALAWFCLWWFAIELFPVSQIVTTIGVAPGIISTADHFLYFACVPALLLLAQALLKLEPKLNPLVYRGLLVGFLSFLSITTVQQNLYATDELVMMQRSLDIQPANARLQSSVGLIHALHGDFKKAEEHFRLAVRADLTNPRYRICLGKAFCDQGRWAEGFRQYMAIENSGGYRDLFQQNTQAAYQHFMDAVQSGAVLDYPSWFVLGVYYAKAGEVDWAIHAFEHALALKPDDTDTLFNLKSLYAARDYEAIHSK